MSAPVDDGAVRRAGARDADEIARLYAQLVANPAVRILPDRLAELEHASDTGLFVVERAGRLAGTVLVCLCADAMFGRRPFAVVENIVVDLAARRQGIGAALLGEVDRFCLSADCSKIMLLSAAERADAHRFFERCGYAGDRKRGFVKYRGAFQA